MPGNEVPTAQPGPLALAMNADGPYWFSALEILLYPVGSSFYRSFSYARHWVSPSVTTEVTAAPNQILRWPAAVVGMRFSTEPPAGSRTRFIPLRQIRDVHVALGNEAQIDFVFGPFVSLGQLDELMQWEIATAHAFCDEVPYQGRNRLLLRGDEAIVGGLERFAALQYQSDPPSGLWDRLIEDPVSEVARQYFQKTSLLRMVGVTQRSSGKPLVPKQIEKGSDSRAPVMGFELQAGETYDAALEQRRLRVPGEEPPILGSVLFENMNANERMRVQRQSITATGNYRPERVWLQPQGPEPAAVLFDWDAHPVFEDEAPKALPLRVPVGVKSQPWFAHEKWLLALGGLLLALAIGAYVIAFQLFGISAGDNQSAGAWVAVGGVIAPFGAASIAYWFHDRRKLR